MSIRNTSMRFAYVTLFALLAACGGTAPVVKRAPVSPKIEPVAPPPAAPSAFEKRWSSACDAQGTVGQCPAPFDRPAVFVDVGEGEHAVPPFCGSLELQDGAAAREALLAKRKALAACFRGAEAGSFVELGPDGAVTTAVASAKAARAQKCVAKLVTRALQGLRGPKPERVVVLPATVTKPSAQVLSKANLDAVIAAHGSAVNECYDAALAVWPGLKGHIASSIVIWFDGRVALVRTGESTLANPMLECCINTAIRGWPFPKPSDGTIALVTFPFRLGPDPQADATHADKP